MPRILHGKVPKHLGDNNKNNTVFRQVYFTENVGVVPRHSARVDEYLMLLIAAKTLIYSSSALSSGDVAWRDGWLTRQ